MPTPLPRVSFNPLTRTLTAVWGAEVNTITLRGLPADTEFVLEEQGVSRPALWVDPVELQTLVGMIDFAVKQVEETKTRVREGSVERLRSFQERARTFLEKHKEELEEQK